MNNKQKTISTTLNSSIKKNCYATSDSIVDCLPTETRGGISWNTGCVGRGRIGANADAWTCGHSLDAFDEECGTSLLGCGGTGTWMPSSGNIHFRYDNNVHSCIRGMQAGKWARLTRLSTADINIFTVVSQLIMLTALSHSHNQTTIFARQSYNKPMLILHNLTDVFRTSLNWEVPSIFNLLLFSLTSINTFTDKAEDWFYRYPPCLAMVDNDHLLSLLTAERMCGQEMVESMNVR